MSTYYNGEELGDLVVACNVCGQIAIADVDEDMESVVCSECGNTDWGILPYVKGTPKQPTNQEQSDSESDLDMDDTDYDME